MTDKVENSGESPWAAESEDSFVIVEDNQTEETQNLDQPVKPASQLPVAIKDENHSTSGPNTVKDEAVAHGTSKDDVTEGTAISQDTGMESSKFDFSKWKLERIGENLCLITDTEKLLLPKCFLGKSNPKVYKHKNKTLIVSSDGHALEVRKDENEKVMFVEIETPVSNTGKSKLFETLDESTDNDQEKLENHDFSNSVGRHTGSVEEKLEMNKKVSGEMQMEKDYLGDQGDHSFDHERSGSKQQSISTLSTTLDAKPYAKEETSVVDKDAFENKNSTDGEQVTKDNETHQKYKAATDSLCTQLNKTDDSVSQTAERNHTVSLENDYQQSVKNFQNNPKSDKKLSTSESHLEEEMTDGAKAQLLIKRDEIDNEMSELIQKMTIDERNTEDSGNVASDDGNPLKDGGQKPHEDLRSKRSKGLTFDICTPTFEVLQEPEVEKEIKELHPNVTYKFHRQKERIICKIEGSSSKECEGAKLYIERLKRKRGYVELNFKDIKNIDQIQNKTQVLKSFMSQQSCGETCDILYEIDQIKSRIVILAKSQASADGLADKVKRCIQCKEEIVFREFDIEAYMVAVKQYVSEHFFNEVEAGLDEDSLKVKFWGLKHAVESAKESLRPVSKSLEVHNSDCFEMILEQVRKEAGDKVDVMPVKTMDKQGLSVKGPSVFVGKAIQHIEKLKKEICVISAAASSKLQAKSLDNEAGRDFIKTCKKEHGVEKAENDDEEDVETEKSMESQWSFSVGHEIILTNKKFKDIKGHTKVWLDIPNSKGTTASFGCSDENCMPLVIPIVKKEVGKEKHLFHEAVENFLKESILKNYMNIVIYLQEVGGWNFTAVMKNVLFPIKKMLTSKLVPMQLTLCINDIRHYHEAERILEDCLELNEELKEPQNPTASIEGSEVAVSIVVGSLTDHRADVIVNTANERLELKDGVLSANLLARAGSDLQRECLDKLQGRKSIIPWSFIVTEGFQLKCKNVFHGYIPYRKGDKDRKSMQDFVYRVLVKCQELKMTSVAFPALGTGKMKYPAKEVAAAIFEAAKYFEMKFGQSCLNQVDIVLFSEDATNIKAFQDVENQLSENQSEKVCIGETLLQVRHTDIKTVKADTVVYFWQTEDFKAAQYSYPPFKEAFGPDAFREFKLYRWRHHICSTKGGDLNVSNIVHVPYLGIDDVAKMKSAFQEAFDFVSTIHSVVCVLYFNCRHPVVKYGDKIPGCAIAALKELPKSTLRAISIIVEDREEYLNIQRSLYACQTGLETEAIQKPRSLTSLPVDSQLKVKTQKTTVDRDDMQDAREQTEENLTKHQSEKKMTFAGVEKGPILEPPMSQKISEDERGYAESIKEPAITALVASEVATERKKLPEYIKEITQKEAVGRTDHTDEKWSAMYLVADSVENRCVEVELPVTSGDETWENLHQNIFKPPFPVRPPTLVFPFESRNKALLICQAEKDADELAVFKRGKYVYKKMKAQCVQRCQMNLSNEYVKTLIDRDMFDRLEQMGIVEKNDANEESAFAVTAFSLAQIQMIIDFLHNIEHKLDKSDTSEKETTEAVTVEKVLDVGKCAWRVINLTLSEQMSALKRQNICVYYDDKDSCIIIHVDGDGNEVIEIRDFIDAVNDLKALQMEEIKPTKAESYTDEFQHWNSEMTTTIGYNCCVYDNQNGVFIAFGKNYDDILKVKHQLGIKQGIVKQTGRRRNRNLDTTASPAVLTFDSGPQSLPSLPSSSEYFHPPARRVLETDLDVDAREVQKYQTAEGIKVFVYIADILKLPVDCIVNAANDNLQHGGGVALVIAKAAGFKLNVEGDDYVKKKGRIPVGMACTTTAGNLPYDCVIHAVGPRWADYSPHTLEKVQQCEKLLKGAILSSFFKAEERGLKSIALPAVSAAIFAVPEKMCAVQYANAVLNYSKESVRSTQKVLEEIHFIDKNPVIVRLIQKTFQTMIAEKRMTDYDVNDFVRSNTSTVYRNPNWEQKKGQRVERHNRRSEDAQKAVKINVDAFIFIEKGSGIELLSPNQKQCILLYKDDILKVKHVNAIVCSEDEYGNGRGVIAKGLLEKAGKFSYKDKKNHEFWLRKTQGDVVVTEGQGTGFQYVFHAVISSNYSTKNPNPKEVIQTAYKNIFAKCVKSAHFVSSITLPVLGTGAAKLVSVEESVEGFILALQDFCCRSPGKDKKLIIHLVCWKDKEMDDVAAILKNFFQKDEPPRKDYTSEEKGKSTEGKDGQPSPVGTDESCVICQDSITDPKTLPCGHVFCKGCIDHYLDNYKQVCPTCGKICGIVTGDQPDGTMIVREQDYFNCAGYEDCGRIDIQYHFPSGKQGPSHPNPGAYYQGISRTAYLPDNKEGREILALLRVAFDRKLIFTIGRSTTTGKEGVITWNDIHHKTNPQPYQNFGYPDPEYFRRVKDELAAKGVTAKDIPELSSSRGGGGYRRQYKF